MEREQINKIIKSLEFVLKRPKMYFGKDDDADITSSYLYGIRHGVLIFIDSNKTIISAWHEAIIKRGHRLTPLNSISEDMKKKDYENKEIVKELIKIEIQTWKIFRDNFEK